MQWLSIAAAQNLFDNPYAFVLEFQLVDVWRDFDWVEGGGNRGADYGG